MIRIGLWGMLHDDYNKDYTGMVVLISLTATAHEGTSKSPQEL